MAPLAVPAHPVLRDRIAVSDASGPAAAGSLPLTGYPQRGYCPLSTHCGHSQSAASSSLMLRAAIPILCVLTLCGCSYSYDVQATVSDGRLIFDANPQWGADCVRRVEVRAEEDRGSEGAGAVWEQSISHDDACENRFPIVYGEPLRGRHHVYGSGGVPDAMVGTPPQPC